MSPKYENRIDFSENGIGSIGSIYITGGGFIEREFKGLSPDSAFGWNELVWKKTPNRTGSFAFTNMDSVDVGQVARCELTIKFMNIQDYMDLRQILCNSRHFTVKFFNRDIGDWDVRDMYCTEQTIAKLLSLKKSVVAGIDVTIKFVGTNLDLDYSTKYSISYNLNGGSGTIEGKTGISYGKNYKIDSADKINPPSGKSRLIKFSTNPDGTGWSFLPNQNIIVFKNFNLYAIWE